MSINVPLRVLLDESKDWSTNQNGIDKYIENALGGGFNALMPCVWNARGATWDSQVEPVKDPQYNAGAYAYLVKSCKRTNVLLIPWFTVVKAARPGLHDEWRLNETTNSPYYNIWLDEFRAYITNLVDEFVDMFHCDGVFLDYMRSGNIWSTRPGRDQYQLDMKRNWNRDFQLWDGNAGLVPDMSEWIRKAAESLLVMLNFVIRTSQPSAEIFGYGRIHLGEVNGPARFTDYQQGRRLREWQAKGLFDWALIEAYDPVPNVSKVVSELNLIDMKYRDHAFPLIANYVQTNETTFVSMDGNQLCANIQLLRKSRVTEHIGIYFSGYYNGNQRNKLSQKVFTDTRLQTPRIVKCQCS